jgi:O-antigen/teichoic acid export membrane protein
MPEPLGARSGIGGQSAMARALWSAVDAAAAPVASLVVLVGLVRALSAQDYGVLVVATAVSSLSVAVNPAIAATTTKFVAEMGVVRGVGNRTVAGTITTALAVVTIVDAILFALVGVFIKPISGWVFGMAATNGQPLGGLLMLSMLAVGLQQVDLVLAAGIRGLECFRRQALAEVLARGATTVTILIVAWRTRSVTAVLGTQCVTYAATLLVRGELLRRILPGRRLFELPGRSEAAAVLRYGGWMWVTAIAGVAYMSLDRVVVGRVLGVAAAGRYNIYFQLTQLIHFIPSSLFAFSLPEFSRLASASGPRPSSELRRAYRSYLVVIAFTASGLAIFIMLFWSSLVHVFGAVQAGTVDWWSSLGLAIGFLVLAYNIAPYYLLLAAGQSKGVSLISTASAMVSVVLMILLIPRYGLWGASLARMAYGVMTTAFHIQARRVLRQ